MTPSGGRKILKKKSHGGIIVAGEVPLLRVLLKMALEDAGFNVVGEAEDSENLLIQCEGNKPAVVIIDFNMDQVDIVRLIENLLDIDPIVAIVVISDILEGKTEMVLAAGARAFLQKPFSMYDMTDLVRKVKPIY
ncbi:response regulator [Candidatus Thorarchaeota archaeon]|nr:MAG: response regulator [Candidatus Thorarchaeota archaeon]